MLIGVAAGVAVAVVLLVGSIAVHVVNRRWQGKAKELQVLVESDTTPQSYGALDESNPTIQDKPGPLHTSCLCLWLYSVPVSCHSLSEEYYHSVHAEFYQPNDLHILSCVGLSIQNSLHSCNLSSDRHFQEGHYFSVCTPRSGARRFLQHFK